MGISTPIWKLSLHQRRYNIQTDGAFLFHIQYVFIVSYFNLPCLFFSAFSIRKLAEKIRPTSKIPLGNDRSFKAFQQSSSLCGAFRDRIEFNKCGYVLETPPRISLPPPTTPAFPLQLRYRYYSSGVISADMTAICAPAGDRSEAVTRFC